MKMTIKTPREVNAKYLHCYIECDEWEGMKINNEDSNEELFKNTFPQMIVSKEQMSELVCERTANNYEFFHIVIDLDEGKITNWTQGVSVEFCVKSRDINFFQLTDKDENIIYQTSNRDTEYVIGPDFMNEYGDYLVLNINEKGEICYWDEDEMSESLENWVNGTEE